MIALVHGTGPTLKRYASTGCFGQLMVPEAGNLVLPGLVWAADNGAFSEFKEAKFLAMLARLKGIPGCKFVTTPDVVGDAEATAALYSAWEPRIRAEGFPVALVAQDGLTPATVPWDAVDALFIGGSTAFKLGPDARALIAAAQARGRWVHAGRVNSTRRLRYFASLDVDSCDGSSLSWFSETYFPRTLQLLAYPQTAMEV